MKYGSEWRLSRRIFHQDFNSTTAVRFQETQTRYTMGLLALLRDKPESFEDHYKYLSSGIILEIIYGLKIQPINDPFVKIVERGLDVISRGLIPGTYLVDAFPVSVKHMPEWFPGAGFKRNAKKWGEEFMASFRVPFAEISRSFKAGTATPSFVTSWLSRLETKTMESEDKDYIRYILEMVSGTAFVAGYETTSSTLVNFTLYMLQHPDAQQKAHEELDRVVGRKRLPEFEDKGSLPYIQAICKEALRLHPVLPFGVPHAVIAEDQYKGMRIPKGSILFANAWAMARNEKDYGSDAGIFRPDRFLESNVRDPATFVFGFGRRICPGRYMAENSLFIAISRVLQVFSITPALNDDGSEIPVVAEWIDGMATHPAPFQASFRPRLRARNV